MGHILTAGFVVQASQTLEFKRVELARELARRMNLDPTDAFRDIQETEHYSQALRNMCAAQLAIERGNEAPLLHLRRPGFGPGLRPFGNVTIKAEPEGSDDEEVRHAGVYV